MRSYWACLDCESIVTLDVHGRCSTCQSDAVFQRSLQHLNLLARLYPEQEYSVMELERLFKQ